jgi:alpha/beta superfamily hydrolase
VGLSDGSFDNGDGECEDLLAVVKWFQGRHPDAPVWLAGFSFGAYVAMRAYQSIDAQRLLLVAPPVTKYEFEAQANVSIPWVVIQGGVDEVISPEAVSTWVHQQILAPEYIWLADADHFFHGRLNNLREAVKGAWGASLAACD